MLTSLFSRIRRRREDAAVSPTPARGAAGEQRADTDGWLSSAREHRGGGRLEEALAELKTLLSAQSDHAVALIEQGEILQLLNRVEDSADSFTLALAFEPSHPRAWLGYGGLLRRAGRLEDAIEHLTRAVELAPGMPDAWFELGLALNAAGRTLEAARAYEQSIAAEPQAPGAYVNLGHLHLAQLGDPGRAETLFRRALELDPDSVETQTNIGLALHEQCRSVDALAHYGALVEAHPGSPEYRWHRATVRLALGDFEHGWEDHEARKARPDSWRKPPPFPEWDGKVLESGELLIHAEQGLGDEVMFASCIPDALARAHCIVECDKRLTSIFERSFPHARVHAVDRAADDLGWLGRYPEIAAQCAIGSLPRFFRRSAADFPAHHGYLKADPALVARCNASIHGAGGALNIGIAWRGGTPATRGELRSTSLSDWSSLLSVPDTRFFALQSASAGELARIRAETGVEVTDGSHLQGDIEALAALVQTLDLVVTVQGSAAHIAGALGKPVWIVLNPSAEWRYLTEGERMPWYPSARLFRRSREEPWRATFERVAAALRAGAPFSPVA